MRGACFPHLRVFQRPRGGACSRSARRPRVPARVRLLEPVPPAHEEDRAAPRVTNPGDAGCSQPVSAGQTCLSGVARPLARPPRGVRVRSDAGPMCVVPGRFGIAHVRPAGAAATAITRGRLGVGPTPRRRMSSRRVAGRSRRSDPATTSQPDFPGRPLRVDAGSGPLQRGRPRAHTHVRCAGYSSVPDDVVGRSRRSGVLHAAQAGTARAPARLRLPRRRTSQPPGSRSCSSGVHCSSGTLALLT